MTDTTEVLEKNIIQQVAVLPEILQKEWDCDTSYWSEKEPTIRFKKFKERYENFEGKTIEELTSMSKVIYTEWSQWKYCNGYNTSFNTEINRLGWKIQSKTEKTLTQIWNQFKDFWQYNTPETKNVFKEMELLSENMLQEWRYKYNFTYVHIYEGYNSNYDEYSKKPKAQLWEEFKEIWEIDITDYNEDKYNEMIKYITEIETEADVNYFKEYPRNFYEFREDSNYHSFDSYSVLEQFQICEDWENRREDADISDESDDDY
jgi:hypothetical protein